MPCKKKITVEMTAHLFFQNVWVHFGLPTSIISYRDSLFSWEILVIFMGTYGHKAEEKHNISSTNRRSN
jgi:hypothetical protein